MSLLGSDQPLHRAHDVALIDLDGVCYRGRHPVPHAAESLSAARDAGLISRYVTNNASREPESVAAQLTELGISASPDEVVTAAQAGAALLAERFPAGSKILVVGGGGLRTAVTQRGLSVVDSADDEPVAVIQGWDPSLSWTELSEAAFAIGRGALHVATNLDTTLPVERGKALGNGSLVAAVVTATGIDPISTGKPEPAIFRSAAKEASGQAPIVLGDRLNTDIAGAVAADIPSLHVLTGVDDARAVVLAVPAERPTYLSTDLRDLLEPHPAPTRSLGGRASFDSPDSPTWAVGAARAAVRDGVLHLADGGSVLAPLGPDAVTVSLDGYRALAAAAWASADDGAPLDPDLVPELVVERR
ncbi:MAG: HAD hydrolase-like protein [Actinomycetales bacterium]